LIPSATGILDAVRVRTAIHDINLTRIIVLYAFRVCVAIFDTDQVRSAFTRRQSCS
jgi:hypothetical protein